MKTEDDSDSEEAADEQENDMCLQEGLDDILQLYASDEDASFLLDNEQPPPVASKLMNNNSDKVAKFDEVIGDSRDINGNKPKVNQCESHCRDINANKTKFVKESCDVIDMDLDTDCILSASPKTKKNFPEKNDKKTPSPPVLLKGQFGLPLTANMIDENCYQQQKQEEVPVFQPMKSNPLKFRWMPSGWCFRHFNRKPCSVQCSFRHDVPSPDVLNRCMPDIIKQCRKGELNGAMNMLESQSYFQTNISEDDLDCLYGYSVNHLKMEFCHSLLQLIATRKLVKQGHIDDIIYLWKRLMYSEDVKPLNDAFYIAKENKLFPNPRAVLIMLEAFSATYGDVYIIWDVITYCTMNKDYIIPEQFINKAVLMLVKCMDTYVLSAAVNWLQKTSPEQQSNINEETLSTFANSLQKRYMLKLAGSVRQCIGHKKCNNDKEEQQNLPRSNLKSNSTNANVALPEDNKRTSNVQSRPVTRSYFELMNQTTGNQQTGIQQENLNQNHAGAVTQVGHDSANCSRLKPKQLLTSRLKSRSNKQPERDFVKVDSEGQRTVTLSNPTRAVTPTNVNNLGPLVSGEQSGTEQDILNDIKHAFDISDWQGLADMFLLCCKNGRISPEVLEQVQLALTTHHTNIGDVWAKFIDHIKQKQRSDPGLRLDNYSLSVLGSEIFYSCYMMDLFDTKDVLLVILNTAFLSLSQFVSHKWNVCLELEAGEYLSKVGMPGKAAEIVLAFPSTSLEFLGAKDRLNTLVQLLIEQLCMEENFSLAFQLFCLAFSWKERGLRTIASDFIKSCLQAEFVVIPVQIYELYIADNAEFDIREAVKRSLLNALVENKNELRKNLYRDMKQSSVLFAEPSYEKPRCICIQSIHTCNEVKAIIECYLIDLYDLFCDLFVMNSRLSSEELLLDVTIIKMASQVHPVGLPYVGQVQMSPLLVKVILLTVFGIHSDLRNNNGNAKVSLHPDSLEKYMKNLDVNSKNIGLEFTAYSQCQNGKRLKVKR
ncbi:uncharacterized protein LOC132746633 isoform X2 [Ruditapes philippinarum]|uniref:uncharacterized protein LOC132746633 isoform X2 n=1 Tax=Ruditapes philippinarum TaxID=129788 RepID=UPI00295AD818|nr:uncharacterized protein LOC132746633 isoform X2 [Ruditapes philippinarum]